MFVFFGSSPWIGLGWHAVLGHFDPSSPGNGIQDQSPPIAAMTPFCAEVEGQLSGFQRNELTLECDGFFRYEKSFNLIDQESVNTSENRFLSINNRLTPQQARMRMRTNSH